VLKRKLTKIEAVERAINEQFQGEDYDKLLKNLSPAERSIYDAMLTEIMATGTYANKEAMWRAHYKRQPPTMEEFLDDPYWLGSSWLPSEENDFQGIYPIWKEVLTRDFSLDSRLHNVVLTGSLGTGKCLGHNELCLMYDGSLKAVQEIVTGDLLMGDDTMPRKILSTTKGRGPLYQIYPSKGEPFICNDAHILCLKSANSDQIEEVSVADFIKWPIAKKNKARLYKTGCDWAERIVDIDPYWLGLWLGDGTRRMVAITTVDEAIRNYHIQYTAQFGLTISQSRGKGAKAVTYYASGVVSDKHSNPLKTKLQRYGLCFSHGRFEKHIPDDYLYNCRDVRLRLFCGLIDTDGSKSMGGKVSKRRKRSNGCYEITVKERRFADQIRFLALSLGFFAQTKIKIVNSTAYWRTFISGAYNLPVVIAHKKTGSALRALCRLPENKICGHTARRR
jgi:hypothetical protein